MTRRIVPLMLLVFACGSATPVAQGQEPDQMELVADGRTSWGADVQVFYFEHENNRCYVATRSDTTVAMVCDWGGR